MRRIAYIMGANRETGMRFAVVVLVAFAGCAFAEPNAYPQQVSDVSTRWVDNWNAKYLNAVMALYAPDAEFMPGSSESWVGTAAIRKNFAGVLAQYSANIHLKSRHIEASGDLAYDSGTYDETITEVKTGKVIRPRGNYLFVFRRQKNGGWKILEQTWTQFGPREL